MWFPFRLFLQSNVLCDSRSDYFDLVICCVLSWPTSNIIAKKGYYNTSVYTMSNNKLFSEIRCLSCNSQDSRCDTSHKEPSLDQDSLKKYRPVSNLTFTDKLFEKIVLRRLSKHMSDHGLGEPLQSAFSSKHSTALIKNTAWLLRNMSSPLHILTDYIIQLQKVNTNHYITQILLPIKQMNLWID